MASRDSAQRNPESFLTQFETEPIIIDEAHKAPALFDEIKAAVDEDRRPGRFILSGSVRFSSKLGIRESFTGRSAHLRLDSMTLTETQAGPCDLKSIHRYLKMGGMPAVCFLRDPAQVERYWIEWLETTCQRDIKEGGLRLDGDLAYRVLEATALLEFPSSAHIATQLRVDARRVRSHLEALESLFLVRAWEPDETSVGKVLYLPFDSGLAFYFKAPLRRLWQVAVAHQWVNQARKTGGRDPVLRYNLTARGSFADFVREDDVLVFSEDAYPSAYHMIRVQALEKRLPKHTIVVASQTDQPTQKLSRKAVSKPWAALWK